MTFKLRKNPIIFFLQMFIPNHVCNIISYVVHVLTMNCYFFFFKSTKLFFFNMSHLLCLTTAISFLKISIWKFMMPNKIVKNHCCMHNSILGLDVIARQVIKNSLFLFQTPNILSMTKRSDACHLLNNSFLSLKGPTSNSER